MTTEWWTAELLDARGYKRGDLPQVKGGSLDYNAFRAVAGGGTIELDLAGDVAERIDWMSDLVRLTHMRDGEATPYGVYIPSAPSREHTAVGVSTSVGLLDGTETLNQPIGRWYSVGARRVVTDELDYILRKRSSWPWAHVPAHAGTLANPVTWVPEDTWLKVANDLAGMVGYGSVGVDRTGTLTVGPYLAPDQRPIAAHYGIGAAAMLADYTDEAPMWEVPNVVRCTVEGSDDTAPIVATAYNTSPSDPFSTVSRGREIVRHERIEAVTQAAAATQARRLLDEGRQVTRRATITHPMDGTWLDDVVSHGPLGFTGPIVERRVELAEGAIVTDTIRRFYTGGQAPWL